MIRGGPRPPDWTLDKINCGRRRSIRRVGSIRRERVPLARISRRRVALPEPGESMRRMRTKPRSQALGSRSASRPTILTVDDDAQVSAAVTRDLSVNYGEDYRVLGVTSGAEALDVMARLALR